MEVCAETRIQTSHPRRGSNTNDAGAQTTQPPSKLREAATSLHPEDPRPPSPLLDTALRTTFFAGHLHPVNAQSFLCPHLNAARVV